MAKVRKLPYYQMESSAIPFIKPKWRGYLGSQGCVPINTQQTVSMERLAPGEPPPPPAPKPPKPTAEQLKAQQAEEARQKFLAKQPAKQPPKGNKAQEQPTPDVIEAEECESPPVFDMLDIPDAMEKMGWPVSATVARRWFRSAKNIYDDNPNAVQPIDDTSVTLNWALKFGNVRNKYNELLSDLIYSEKAVEKLKEKIFARINEVFVNQNSAGLDFDTTPFIKDLRQFHIDWQFQRQAISTMDTCDGILSMTDLTGTLANFAIYIAVGNVEVISEKHFKYDKQNNTKSYCIDPKIKVTHVYVYIKDNYSFNDERGSSKTQYLGHWNKKGLIVTTGGVISEFVDGKIIHTDLGNSRKNETTMSWDYLMKNSVDKPVDARRGMMRKFREDDVYFPIYNGSYNEWRAKHKRGRDFMIYSKPKYVKLKAPIEFSLTSICRPPEKM